MDPTGWELKVSDEDVRLTDAEPPEVPPLKPASTVPFQLVGEYAIEVAKECRKFGKAIWEVIGKGNDVDFVFEHPGEATFPVSCFVVKRGGMVVFCAGTTGYNITFDAGFVWMRQKRIQGRHFATLMQASQANRPVIERRGDPCMSEVFPWPDIARAHTKMWKNEHKPGNEGHKPSGEGNRRPEG